jgi:hypothetical protein
MGFFSQLSIQKDVKKLHSKFKYYDIYVISLNK